MGMLDSRVAIVTGAGRGIGKGEALLLAEQGACVVVNDIGGAAGGEGTDSRPAEQVVEEIRAAGGEAIAHFDDISEPAAADSVVALALATWGRLDIVVNNAGILRDRMVYNLAVEDWDAVIKVHLRGHFLMTKAACAYWRQRAKAGKEVYGRIVNTSSSSGILGNAGQANYGSAKAAIAGLTQITSLEMRRFGVTVNAIAPAARTRLTEAFAEQLAAKEGAFDTYAPENVAPMVAYLSSPEAAHISGQVFYVRGGLVELYESWKPAGRIEQEARWSPEEIAARAGELFATQATEYVPSNVETEES